MPTVLVEQQNNQQAPPAVYRAGSYLRTTLWVLTWMQGFLLAPLFISIVKRTVQIVQGEFALLWPTVFQVIVLLPVGFIIVRRHRRHRRRQVILEDELLSIHSCAIVWQAVIVAHYQALEKCDGYEHYTANLARVASEIAEK